LSRLVNIFTFCSNILAIERELTNKKLLQLLVAVVDAELLEAVGVEDLEAVDIQHADERVLVRAQWHLYRFVDLHTRTLLYTNRTHSRLS
jgi:hypothetical protein